MHLFPPQAVPLGTGKPANIFDYFTHSCELITSDGVNRSLVSHGKKMANLQVRLYYLLLEDEEKQS